MAWGSIPPRAGRSQAASPGVWRQRPDKADLEISAKLCQRTPSMSRPSKRCSSTVTGSWGKPGCAGAPAALSARLLEQSSARQPFGLYSRFCARKAKGNTQMRSFCAKPCRLGARLQAALCRQCPALPGHPGTALWMGFAAVFPFISTFFCLQQILHGVRGSTAAKVCIGECSFVTYSGFLSIFCLLVPVQALKITGYFKSCSFVPRLSTAGCQLEREGGEVSGPCGEV